MESKAINQLKELILDAEREIKDSHKNWDGDSVIEEIWANEFIDPDKINELIFDFIQEIVTD